MPVRPSYKLVIILHADVVGSTMLVQHDETLAHQRIQDCFRRFSKRIEAYGGITHELRGDALVAEFDRASDAVCAGIAFQTDNTQVNATLEDGVCPEVRIGVSMGEVIVADNTITGAGVVLAQRLEQLADPGGVCIQDAAYQSVPKRLPFVYESLGEQRVKGFEEPVRAYRVALKSGMVIPPPHPRRDMRKTKLTLRRGAVAVFLVVVGSALAWWQPWKPEFEPASKERMTFPLPDRPSIAVLPFNNMSDDPKQEYFVDGMTEDLITDLSKLSGLFVIARNSTFTYKGKSVKVRQVAEELGVRYLLEGSVRRVDNQIRVNAQLIDATTGGHLWAERFDGKPDDIFALQDAITKRVVQALELHLTKTDKDRQSEDLRTNSLEAYDLVLQARKLMTRFSRKAADEAHDLLEQAIALDPEYGDAYSLLGLYYFDAWRLWGERQNENLMRSLELARTGIKLNPLNPAPHVLMAQVHQFRREFEAANAQADAALALRPNDAVTLANLGSMLRYAERAEEAAQLVERAMRLDPYHPPNYLEWLGDAYFLLGRQDCMEPVERGIALDPDFVALHVIAAKCYASLGNEAKARAAGAEILRLNPGFTLSAFASYVPFRDQHVLQWNVEMLRKAGVPE